MLKTSAHCLLIFFIFENLVVHGLITGVIIEQKPKPLPVEIWHGKLLPKDPKLIVALSNSLIVRDTARSAKVLIKNNVTTHSTKDNKTSDLKFNVQNITATTVVNYDNIDENKTEEYHKYNTEKDETSNNRTTVAATATTTKPISEINSDRTDITPNIEGVTTVSDLTTDTSNEKTSISVASSLETSSVKLGTLSSTIDSTTSMEFSSTEQISSSNEPQQSKVSANEKENEKMSSGIIALVMAIVFAIVVIIVYIGLLVWRRYLEYRYGNRELLVNDLEFDTNDLRHFEL